MSNLFKSKFILGLVMVVAFAFTSTANAAITMTLKYGMSNSQVKELQQNLNGAGYTVSTSGAGSMGYESNYFGSKTKAAVMAYQTSKGLVADGIFGPASRAAWTGGSVSTVPGCTAGAMYSSTTGAPCAGGTMTYPAGCTSSVGFSPTTGASCATGVITTPVGGAFMVGLSSDTPASTTIPDAANANFTKFYVSAGATPVSITSLYVTRSGLSINSDVENIKILNSDNVAVSSTGSLNSNNKAQITFSPALTIPANTTQSFFIRAGIDDGVTGGKTVQLGIASSSDIIANATAGGSFPINGNVMGVVALDIGTVTLDEDGTVTDSQPSGGDTNVVVNKFKLTAGSVEAVTIKQIAVERAGTASATDTSNIELFDVSANQTVGTVTTWDANGFATFNNLNIVLDKGQTKRYEVRVDIIGGASLTVNADLTDGSDSYVQVMGNTYGFYITPTNSMTDGKGASNQTIQTGSLTVTKSSTTPATGNIASGSDVHLATFDFQVLGEPMKITSVNVDSTLGTMVYTEVTNVKLVDATTGALLAGPKDLVVTTEDATFTDVIILPVGVTKVKVTANIASSVSASDTIKIDLDNPATGIVAKGMTSNDTVTPTPASAVSGNTLTVQAAALAATTLTTPAARSVVKGQQDFVWATASLSAANSGEDVTVTALVVESTTNVAANDTNSGSEDLDNVEIWADLTSASSARGDAYETLVSTTKQFTGTNDADDVLSFTLTPSITVPKNGSVSIAVVADLSASAVTSDTFTISLDTDAGDVTANGKDTGTSVTVTPTGAGQLMTVSAGGTVTLTVDSSSPSASLLLDTSTEQTTAVFRLAANNTENLNVDSFKITDDGTNGNDVVSAYKFYNGATLLGSVTPDGSGNAELFLTSGQLVIPANSYKLVTVKAVLNDIDGTGFVNGDTLITTVNAAGDVDTTGVASGTAVDSTDTSVDAATHTAYEAYPTVTFDLVTAAGGTLTGNANQLVAVLNIYNNGNKDITFEASDSNLSIQTVVVQGDNTGTTPITIKDQDGNTLDSVSDFGASAQFDFNFSSAALTVSPGTTEKVYIYADTSDLEDDNDSIQIWLDDTAADLEYAINNDDGEYTEGDYVFKNDLFGATYTNPS